MEYISQEDFKKQVSALMALLLKTEDETEKEKINLEIKRLKKIRFNSRVEDEMDNMKKRRR